MMELMLVKAPTLQRYIPMAVPDHQGHVRCREVAGCDPQASRHRRRVAEREGVAETSGGEGVAETSGGNAAARCDSLGCGRAREALSLIQHAASEAAHQELHGLWAD